MTICFCGCGDKAVHRHHVIYAQAVRRAGGLLDDPRNLVDAAFRCHHLHHLASRRYEVSMLPDSVFGFASELLGPGAAFEFIARRYSGMGDSRMEALLEAHEAAA